MTFRRRIATTLAGLALVSASLLLGGCTTTMVLVHLHDKLTEGDPPPCMRLNSVERALQARCAPFEKGSLDSRDVLAPTLPECPLTLAARDPQFWPVLPELLARGAVPERCTRAPLAALAQAFACPPFHTAAKPELDALRWLAQADARSVQHDVMRALSCPSAQVAGLSSVLDGWLADGLLPAGGPSAVSGPSGLSFGPLGALHPSHLNSPLARRLEAQGHTARAALTAYDGRLPSGFDQALRDTDPVALDWWLARAPELVNRAPPAAGNALPWLPLARVLAANYLADPARQRWAVEYLLARGADPWRRLPHEPQRSVVGLARELNSPLTALLDPPRPPASTPPSAAPAASPQAVAQAPGHTAPR